MGAARSNAHRRARETRRRASHAGTTNLPEKQALEILLRSVAGYAAAPRASVAAGATWPPTSRASIGSCCCRQASPRRRPWHLQDPRRRFPATTSGISGSDSTGQPGGCRCRGGPEPSWRAGLQSKWRAGGAGAPGRSGRADAWPASRAGAGRSECPGAGQRSHTAWCGTARHDTPRRDPRAADPTAPVSAGWVYSLPT